MKLRVGLIGLGPAWEKRHRSALRSLSDRFEVRAVCEQVAQRAEKVSNDFSADRLDGYRALARRQDIDAVLILSPQWYGALPIFAACDEGKAIYCASAMDLSLDQAALVKQRVEAAGIAFMVEFPRRLAPATLRLKELIATRLGPPQLLFCHQRRPIPTGTGQNGAQLTDAAKSGLARELIEMFDWCRYVVGTNPAGVIGNGRSRTAGQGGYRSMSVDFSSASDQPGPLAQISCGQYLPEAWIDANSFRPPAALQVTCENGVAFVDLPSTLIWFDEAGRHVESLEADVPVGEQLFRQFFHAVTSLLRSTDDLDMADLAVRAVLAAEESQRCGQRVELS